MKIVTSEQMRRLDAMTIAHHVSGEALMERAGSGIFRELQAFVQRLNPRHARRFLIVAGKGNNGGDGFVIARHLAEQTAAPVIVVAVCGKEALPSDAKTNAMRLPPRAEFVVAARIPGDYLVEGTVIVDALLGTGVRGPLREPYRALIQQINDSALPVIAVDLPSGVNADDGTVPTVAVQADLTVTVGLPKIGLFIGEGLKHRGLLRFVDIGIPQSYIGDLAGTIRAVLPPDVRPFLGRLSFAAHKTTMGKILVLGGSRSYPGAPLLSGSAALRAGAGLVTVGFPLSAGEQIQPKDHALILRPIDDAGKGYFSPLPPENITELTQDQDVIVVGPGIGRAPETIDWVKQLLATDKPVVLDADGLFALSRDPSMLPRAETTVITPHEGEFRRIAVSLGEGALLSKTRTTQAQGMAQALGCYVILKGPATVIASPQGDVSLNSTGTAALATGGTGDVLTGVIAGFMGQTSGDDVMKALEAAVFIHGLASELAPRGMRNLIADDLMALLGKAMTEVSPFA